MASVRKRTWSTKTGEKSAWVVAYTHKGKQHLKTFPSKREATAWRAEMQTEQKKGIHTPASVSITVSEAAGRWLDQAMNDGLERSTVVGYQQQVKYHIEPFLGRSGWPISRPQVSRISATNSIEKAARRLWCARLSSALAASSRTR